MAGRTGLGANPARWIQPDKQEGQAICRQRLPQLGQQEGVLRLRDRRLPGRGETSLLQIHTHCPMRNRFTVTFDTAC